MPFRALYPNATEKEWKLPKKESERTVNVLQLRDANIEPGQFWAKCESAEIDQEIDDEEEEGGNRRNTFPIPSEYYMVFI